MQKTIYVMPNPYGVLDAKGLLAGGCQAAEELRKGSSLPMNQKIGAELLMVPGSYNDRAAELAEALDTGRVDAPAIPPVYSRAEYVWKFTASMPVPVVVTGATEGFYVSRFRCNGTAPCLFSCKDAEDLPLLELAEQRHDAIERFKAAYGKEPPVDSWAKQFELDADVAEVMKDVADKRKVEADAAESKAKAAKEAAEQDAKAAADKATEARKKAIAKARERLKLPDLVPPPGGQQSTLGADAHGGTELPPGHVQLPDGSRQGPAAPPGSPPRIAVEMTPDGKGGASGELKADPSDKTSKKTPPAEK